MRLRSLSVSDFGAIEQASVTFADGLNVLHGPNDLGKSTLAAAIRAALLLQHGSSAARPFIPWGTPRKPTVTLTFELDGRYWRVHKVFGTSSGGKSVLSWSNDGEQFSTEEEGRGVDGRLRQLLGWGLAAPGGRGGSHGFPKSFLATVLLGEQALPYRLLDQSLEADAEDTGKARLIEALQAMATDPLYQHVLEHAQARVDEAFTAKGKRSTRKGSPFERVTADIKQRRTASEELTRQVADSDAVVSRLGELSARRDAQLSTRAAAAERMAAVDEALAVVEARAALQAEVDAAEAALAEIERNRDEIAKLHASRREAEAAVPAGQATLEQAGAALEQARTLRDRTQAAVEALASGEDEASRTETHALRERLRTLDEAATALEDTRARIEAWAQAEAAAATATEALERATQTASASAAAVVEATAAVEQAGRRKDGLVDASRWAEAEALRGKLEALAAAERDAETARKAVGALRARAEALRATLCEDFPDAAERQAMQGAWQALALAKAALGGGVRVSLDLTVPVVASSDGAPSRDVDPKGRLDADRAVVLELEGVGSINVEAGDPSAHAAADDAATAWAPHAQRLEALGLANVDALRAAATVRGETEAEAASLEREADVAEAGVQAPTAQARVELEQALASAERVLGEVDAQACRAVAAAEEDVAAAREEAEAAHASAERALAAAKSEAASAQTDQRVVEARAEAAAAAVRAAALDDTPDAAQAGAALEDARAKNAADRAEVTDALDGAAQRKQARVQDAERARADAAAGYDAALQAEQAARAVLEQARQAVTAATAALDVRREQAEHHDPLAAAERVARAQDALAGHPQPALDVSAEAVQAARDALKAAEEALEEAETAVRQQEGALQHVGGQVVRERAQMAREALDDAQRQEAEVTLDYEGWRLLLGTLREVENETGAHLGRALGGAVASRFASLSGGRYQGAALGADLETEGVLTPQGLQDLDRFSEGVKEQLATLLRVSVAEQLGTMLVLDDHLAQTDPGRAQWFRALLQESASSIQVVVLTCRPEDYRAPDDTAPIAATDLSTVIQRRDLKA